MNKNTYILKTEVAEVEVRLTEKEFEKLSDEKGMDLSIPNRSMEKKEIQAHQLYLDIELADNLVRSNSYANTLKILNTPVRKIDSEVTSETLIPIISATIKNFPLVAGCCESDLWGDVESKVIKYFEEFKESQHLDILKSMFNFDFENQPEEDLKNVDEEKGNNGVEKQHEEKKNEESSESAINVNKKNNEESSEKVDGTNETDGNKLELSSDAIDSIGIELLGQGITYEKMIEKYGNETLELAMAQSPMLKISLETLKEYNFAKKDNNIGEGTFKEIEAGDVDSKGAKILDSSGSVFGKPGGLFGTLNKENNFQGNFGGGSSIKKLS